MGYLTMKTYQAVVIGLALTTLPILSEASVIINVTEQSGDVVFDISGSLDMTGANLLAPGKQVNGLVSGGSNWYIATGDSIAYNGWVLDSVDVPFGTDTSFHNSPAQATGDNFGIYANITYNTPVVMLGQNYVSGDSINSLLSYSGQTFSSLGLISGVYNFTIPNDSIELRIGQAAASVPEPASLALLSLGLVGLGISRKQKSA